MAGVDLRQTFVLANAFKEGDRLVGGRDDRLVRREAQRAIESLRVAEITSLAFVDDGISDALERSLDRRALAEVSGLTIERLKQTLLGAGADWIRVHRPGLRSEVIAAVVKVMTDA